MRNTGLLHIFVVEIIMLFTYSILSALTTESVAALKVEATFFVAVNGNDKWTGKLPDPNQAETDGPFATLERARDAARALKSSGLYHNTITIMVRGGIYYLSRPFTLQSADSGIENHPIIYTSYPNERPIFSGGKQIKGWKRGKNNLWVTEIPEARNGAWYFRQLFLNGERRCRARVPNKGHYTVAGSAEPTKQAFRFNPGQLKNSWTNLEDIDAIILQIWTEARLRIANINEANNIVTFTGNSWRTLAWSNGYILENVFEELDEPGEWYLNRKTGILYYYPLTGEDMTNVEVIAPILTSLVRFEGNAKNREFVHHITLRGLSFYHTSWLLPEHGLLIRKGN